MQLLLSANRNMRLNEGDVESCFSWEGIFIDEICFAVSRGSIALVTSNASLRSSTGPMDCYKRKGREHMSATGEGLDSDVLGRTINPSTGPMLPFLPVVKHMPWKNLRLTHEDIEDLYEHMLD